DTEEADRMSALPAVQTLVVGRWTLDSFVLRLGLRYVKGLSEQSGKAIVLERMKRPFVSIDDLHHRVPELRKDELRKLAAVGAFNFIQDVRSPKSNVQRPDERPKSNVQRPMSKVESAERTLDIGRWTLDTKAAD